MKKEKVGNMINLLGIGLDYLMLKNDKVRGDVRQRQIDYATKLGFLTLVIYSPKGLGFKPQQWSDNLWVYPTDSRNKMMFIIDAYKIASKICRSSKIDTITTEDPFTTGFIGYLLKRRFKIALNIQSHVDFYNNQYWIGLRRINWFFNRLAKFILKRADTIRVGTYYEQANLSKELRIATDKVHVIPVNSEIKRFIQAEGTGIRSRYLNSNFDKMLLFTGRLVEQKGIPDLLRAIQLIIKKRASTLLLIVGNGPKGGLLKDMANDLGLRNNIIFTGSIDHKDIPKYVAACDVYTISSLFEGTCISMAEAMAASKPVVATNFAGAQDLICDGETGFIVKQQDYKSFADRVVYLLDNPKKAKQIGYNASAFIYEKFANNKNIDQMINLWEKTATVNIIV